MTDAPMGKVMLRDQQGHYLCGDRNNRFFSQNRLEAAMLDFYHDGINEEVDRLWREEHRRCTIISVDPPDRFELCDRCGCRVMPVKALFTGEHFLCPDCAYFWNRRRPSSQGHGQTD
jgi:hypothetical protein